MKGKSWEGVDNWTAFVTTAMNFRVPQNVQNFLTG
jgi:hypothetical protein